MVPVKNISRKRFIKRVAIALGIPALLVLGLHLWFVHNARFALKQWIGEQSKGKIKFELSQLDLNLWTKRLQIHKADLLSTDTATQAITYHVSFNKLSLRVGSVWSLLFSKKLLLDSIKLYDPVIQVIQWRKDSAQSFSGNELSIPQEMGKIYKSLTAALDEFGIRRIIIDNATISLINKMNPRSAPATVSRIFFDLARPPTRKDDKGPYTGGEQTVTVRIEKQDIALPGGRHRLAFRSLGLQLIRERIDLDSCTITALPTDSIKSNYRIFFKKLSLTGVDLAALSIQNKIKADSFYCEEPLFDFNLFRSDAVKKKTEIPDPNKIVRELTSNIDLKYVGVKNAGLHFDIYGRTRRSFFNSKKDNFEIHGFRINADSLSPVTIRRFDMTLRDYQLYNEDSSSIFSFDSLQFANNRIVLNNFATLSRTGDNKVRDKIDIRVPYFSISKLNWYQLIFEQNLVASAAVLHSPVINYTPAKLVRSGKKINLFAAFQNLDSLVALDNLTVINGEVNMQLGAATSFNVQNIGFNILSNKLLQSTNKEGVRSSVEHLSFSKAVLRIKDITARLQNARFTGNNLMYADRAEISGSGNKVAATVNNIYIDNLQVDDNAQSIEVDGLRWKSGTVNMSALPLGKPGTSSKKNSGNIRLKNIEGYSTMLSFANGPGSVSTFVQSVNALSFTKNNNVLEFDGLRINGSNLVVKNESMRVNADAYKISGTDPSVIRGLQVQQVQGRDSFQLKAPTLNFTADVNRLLAMDLHFTDMTVTHPVATLNKWNTAGLVSGDKIKEQIPFRIDKFTALEPGISIVTHSNDSLNVINIPASDRTKATVSDLLLSNDGLRIGAMFVNAGAATFTNRSGAMLGIEEGNIELDAKNIVLATGPGKMNWSGDIDHLSVENVKGSGLVKSGRLHFEKASLGNLHLSSKYMNGFEELMKANLAAWILIPSGRIADSTSTIQWYNANYTNNNRTFSVDSFVYHPIKPLDTVLAYAPYQLDYITLNTGAVTVSGMDLARYKKDRSFQADTIRIADPVLTVYRDKLPPSSPVKKNKALPVGMIKSILLPAAVQTVLVKDGIIIYSEKNATSREEAIVLLSNVNASLANIKNRDLQPNDSLSLLFKARLMDSAAINLELVQSYMDSLSGFRLQVNVKSADLSILNPILVPLLNIKISSGKLDSVDLSAIGRKDMALGEIDLHYRKLRIQLINNGDPDASTFFQRIASSLANRFLIRRNNHSRKGVIYYNRTGDQSFVNYIVKMTVSGILSSIGVKNGRRYMRQYKKELRKTNQPPIVLEPLLK